MAPVKLTPVAGVILKPTPPSDAQYANLVGVMVAFGSGFITIVRVTGAVIVP